MRVLTPRSMKKMKRPSGDHAVGKTVRWRRISASPEPLAAFTEMPAPLLYKMRLPSGDQIGIWLNVEVIRSEVPFSRSWTQIFESDPLEPEPKPNTFLTTRRLPSGESLGLCPTFTLIGASIPPVCFPSRSYQ